jgi:hypothetical protein
MGIRKARNDRAVVPESGDRAVSRRLAHSREEAAGRLGSDAKTSDAAIGSHLITFLVLISADIRSRESEPGHSRGVVLL